MTVLTQGLNRIRDLHKNDIVDGELGTSGSAVAVSQTGLQTPIAASVQTVTTAQTSQSNQFRYSLDSTTATGNSFREITIRNATPLSYDRAVFPTYAHDGTNNFVGNKTYFYTQQ